PIALDAAMDQRLCEALRDQRAYVQRQVSWQIADVQAESERRIAEVLAGAVVGLIAMEIETRPGDVTDEATPRERPGEQRMGSDGPVGPDSWQCQAEQGREMRIVAVEIDRAAGTAVAAL